MPNSPKTGVDGTVEAFNFIRRVAFPSTPRIIGIYAGICLTVSLISLLIANESLPEVLVFAGAVLVWPGIAGEFVNSLIFLRKDRILDFRRLMGVEVIATLPIVGVLLISSLVGGLLGISNLWIFGFIVGLAVSFPVRFLTPMAMSSTKSWRKLLSGIPVVGLTLLSFLVLSPYLLPSSRPTVAQSVAVVTSGLILSSAGVALIIRRVELQGDAEIRHSPMGLFRAFLDHWLKKTTVALEERLLSLSTEGTIETKILAFSGNDSKPIGSIVVSNFHPGPYRDMGSGGLPSELKNALEQSKGGIVQVPHGVSNHKLNIVSHRDTSRLLIAASEHYPEDLRVRTASPMIREQEGEAIVSGQAFGNIAILTVTLAPHEMEDLPSGVSTEIEKEASELGLEVLVIDAHNSLIGQTSITPEQATRIIIAGIRVLGKLKNLSQEPFMAGSAYDALKQYSIADGIGPGGLSALVLKVGSNNFSYVTIDGNNMQSGFRDRILNSIKEIGVSDAEIMTTDTHLVTGQVRSPLGYYPVGAALSAQTFAKQVNDTIQKATANLGESEAGATKFSLEMAVLGSEAFQSISGFIGRIAREIGKMFSLLEVGSLVLAVLVLLLVRV